MRRWILILAGWTLILAQGGLALGMSQLKAPVPCSCCKCGGFDCCVSKTPNQAPNSADGLPVAPNDSSSLLLGILPAASVLRLPHSTGEKYLLPDFSPFRTPAVPVFIQNCTFLI